jgi:hypothetical protein
VNRLRLVAAAGVLAGALAPLAPAAHAMACHPDFRDVCAVVFLPCRELAEHPKLGLECPPMG